MTITQAIYEYLSGALETPVYTMVPADMPDKFVLIEKTSGGEEDFIYSSMFAIQSWASSLAEADILNDEVKVAMRDANTVDMICSCKLNSDYNFTDTAEKKYRFQAVYDVVHY